MIFLFSAQQSLPGLEARAWDFVFKKSAHLFVYAVLYFWVHRALVMRWQASSKPQIANRIWLFAFGVCLLYAASDEFHQSFVPGRSATFRDLGFDTLGMSVTFLRIYKYI
jgi:VanZ family protein